MYEEVAFTHAFQPIINIEQEKTVACEVLLRGINGDPPAHVFSKIDQKNLIAFDQYSREKALNLASQLGIDCSLTLNFTPGSILFDEGSYVEKTIDIAKSLGFNPDQLVLEITESEFIYDLIRLTDIVNKLRSKNVVIAIDDFGAGYAGLKMLADIQPDIIKIDMNLLRNISVSGPRQSIIRAIYNVCEDLGIDILAEGVETEAELTFLHNIGINIYQGFLFAKPGFEHLPKITIPPQFISKDFQHSSV
jgi:EAL domain-containing protein (putative c-di-GMP-specific phosphodiesterase class I)